MRFGMAALHSVLLLAILSVASTATGQVLTISIGDASVLEGDSFLENVVLQFPLTITGGVPTKDVTVRFSTASGTAVANSDFNFANNVLVTIPAGLVSGFANVAIIEDLNVEPDETFTVALGSPGNAISATALQRARS